MIQTSNSRLIAFVLTLCMIVTMMPIGVFAETPTGPATTVTIHKYEATTDAAIDAFVADNENASKIVGGTVTTGAMLAITGSYATTSAIEKIEVLSKVGDYSSQPVYQYIAPDNAEVKVETIINNYFNISGAAIQKLTLDDRGGKIQNVHLVNGANVQSIDWGTKDNKIFVLSDATVTVGNVEYTNSTAALQPLKLMQGAINAGANAQIALSDAGYTVTPAAATAAVTVATATPVEIMTSIEQLILSASNAKVKVFGDIGTKNSMNVGFHWNNGGICVGNGVASPVVEVTGTVNGVITRQGADNNQKLTVSMLTTSEGGYKISLRLIDHYGVDTFVAYDKTEDTLRVYGQNQDCKVENLNTPAAITYNVIMESGTFDANGSVIEGNVTFKGTGKTLETAPVLTGTGNLVSGGNIVFEDGCSGYVNGQLADRHQNGATPAGFVTIGNNACAAFSNFTAAKGATDGAIDNLIAIGDNATVVLTSENAKLYNSAIELATAGEQNEANTASTATFLLSGANGDAKVMDDIVIPAGKQVAISYYGDTAELDKAITVGSGAKLEISGAGADKKLTIKGSALTTLVAGADAEENATLLKLTDVNHDRANGCKDIVTANNTVVYLNGSTVYTGDQRDALGSFITGQDAENEYARPESIRVYYGDNVLTTPGGFEHKVDFKLDENKENAILTTVSYSSVTSGSFAWDLKLTVNTYTYALTDIATESAVAGETVTIDETFAVSYVTTGAVGGSTATIGKSSATLEPKDVAAVELREDMPGYGILYANNGYKAELTTGGEEVASLSLEPEEETPMLMTFSLNDWNDYQEFGPVASGTALKLTVTPLTVEEGGSSAAPEIVVTGVAITIPENEDVVLENGTYNANFVVNTGHHMVVTLSNAAIGTGSSFDIRQDATLEIKVVGAEGKVCAPILMRNDDSTLILNDGVVLYGTSRGNQDFASLEVARGVDGAKVLINGDVKIIGADHADDSDQAASTPMYLGHTHSAVNGIGYSTAQDGQQLAGSALRSESHSQSVGVYTEGEVEFIVAQGKTLTVQGGNGKDRTDTNTIADHQSFKEGFAGGAGMYVTATGSVTFSGKGVIEITGGTGGQGANGDDNNGSGTADFGAHGGYAGVGIYNGGNVTVAMTSGTWEEGQLIVTGGKGGNGGNGIQAAQARHGGSLVSHTCATEAAFHASCTNPTTTKGGDGGDGGNSGYAIYNGSDPGVLNINSGVFRAYSGTVGALGVKGNANSTIGDVNCSTADCKAECQSGHSSVGEDGENGSDNKYAVVQNTLNINGGTAYAFSGNSAQAAYGFVVTTLNISNEKTIGTIWGDMKKTSGFDNAVGTMSEDMMPTDSALKSGVSLHKATNKLSDYATDVYSTRIKVGTEFDKYRVLEMTYTPQGGSTTITFKPVDMYVNEQGFLYVYLPDGPGINDKIQLTLQKDGANEYVQVLCGGNNNGLQAYGHGNISGGGHVDSVINYNAQAIWGEAFAYNGTKYNGIDLDFVNANKNIEKGTIVTIKTAEQLAAVAYMVNTGLRADGFEGVTFSLEPIDVTTDSGVTSGSLSLARFCWDPIGTAAKPFKGILEGNDVTIKGIRMSESEEQKYAAFGLFGYTDGATIRDLTVDNTAIDGTPYQKTLTTDPKSPVTVTTKSGGQYDWNETDLKWGGTSDSTGVIVGYAKATAIDGCTVNNVNIDVEARDNNNTYVGGIVGQMAKSGTKAGSVVDCTVGGDVELTANKSTDNVGVYAGGVAGASDSASYESVTVTGTVVTASGSALKGAYAGGLIGAGKNDVVKDASVLTTTVYATNTGAAAEAGGLVGNANGTTIYKSFVRGGSVGSTGASGKQHYGSLLGNVANTKMYGCYSQGVDTAWAAVANSTGGEYVGCYSADDRANGFVHTVNNDAVYNCYVKVDTSTTQPAINDGWVQVSSSVITSTGIAKMNDELLKMEGTNKDTNDSGFDWTKSYGEPIAYITDTGVNNSYPIHGEPHFVELVVEPGSIGYGTGKLAVNANVIADTETDNYASYWVMDGTEIDLKVKALAILNGTDHAKYGLNAVATTTAIDNLAAAKGSEATVDNVTAVAIDSVINLYFKPATFVKYTLDLKTAADADSATTGTARTTVKLDGSIVNRYEKAGSEVTLVDGELTNATAAIKTIVLSIDNGGQLGVPATPTGWTKHASSGATYLHYTVTGAGATAAEVTDFLNDVTITPTTDKAKFRVSAFVYESEVPFIESNYGGHFYQYVPNAVNWQTAYTRAQNYATALGEADTYLANITSAGENNYLYSVLKVSNAWMGAVGFRTPDAVVDLIHSTGNTEFTTSAGWQWVGGPEINTPATGNTVWSQWRAGEPNNYGGYEWAGAFAYGGQNDWNDFNGYNTYGYIIEYQAGKNESGASFANDHFDYEKTAVTTTNRPGSSKPSGNTGGNVPTDPAETGVAEWLITGDHIKYMTGYTDKTFRPNQNMTRAEVAQMFYNLLKDKDVEITKTFSDVNPNKWYAKAVNTLASMDVLTGVGNNKFSPDRSITRAEFVTIAMKFAKATDLSDKAFSDVPQTKWFYDYVMMATNYSWIGGYTDGTFRPYKTISRAEVVTIVNQMLFRRGDADFIAAHLSELITFPDVKKSFWAYTGVMEATNAHDYVRTESIESWTGAN